MGKKKQFKKVTDRQKNPQNINFLTHFAAEPLRRFAKPLHFLSSFVRRVTYLKISPIRLDLAKKNQFKKVADTDKKFLKNRFSDQP